jgi:hypothetical protein
MPFIKRTPRTRTVRGPSAECMARTLGCPHAATPRPAQPPSGPCGRPTDRSAADEWTHCARSVLAAWAATVGSAVKASPGVVVYSKAFITRLVRKPLKRQPLTTCPRGELVMADEVVHSAPSITDSDPPTRICWAEGSKRTRAHTQSSWRAAPEWPRGARTRVRRRACSWRQRHRPTESETGEKATWRPAEAGKWLPGTRATAGARTSAARGTRARTAHGRGAGASRPGVVAVCAGGGTRLAGCLRILPKDDQKQRAGLPCDAADKASNLLLPRFRLRHRLACYSVCVGYWHHGLGGR